MSEISLPPWPWDAPPRKLLEERIQQLADQLRPGPVYLLVDPGLGGDPPGIDIGGEPAVHSPTDSQQARERAWGRSVLSLHVPEFRGHKEIEFPYLVRLEGVRDPLLAVSVEWAMREHLFVCAQGGGAYRIGGWIQPNGALDDRNMLARLSSGIDDEGLALARQLTHLIQWGDKLLRLFDRRVLHTLRVGSTRIDWSGALRGIRTWIYLDHNFNLHSQQGSRGQPSSLPLMQGATHTGLVRHFQAIHGAQSTILRTTFPLSDDSLSVIAAKVKKMEHRLSYPEDRAAYAAEAVLEPAFEYWPGLPKLIMEIRRTRQELADALDDLRHEWASKPIDQWSAAA
ncbi:hypothetical protein WKW79_20340 [Variovorax robiniae]|uniref:DUF4123 domain-containing protein n=1 Tax=Variovorax robiniae TaxID=1836199 RepID=A0ABU8XB42_9BURK